MTDKDLVFMADRVSIIDMYNYGTATHDDFDPSLLRPVEPEPTKDSQNTSNSK